MKESVADILQHYNPEEKELILKAFNLADSAHEGQKRKTGEPYIVHPLAVAKTLAQLKMDSETIIASLLHDTLEDTSMKEEQIEREFGTNVAFLVSSVTKLREVDYHGEHGLAENFRKMLFATAKDIRVVIIKLADVLHNMKTLDALPAERKKRYAREVLEIYSPIADRLGIGWLKGELEDLAFPYVYPEEYKKIFSKVEKMVLENKQYTNFLKPLVQKYLKKEGVKVVSINARVKHLYSLWKKLDRLEGNIEKVYDIVALRIIVPDVQSCYAALGTIHKHWRPLPGRIKDYIALPKPNGYRSIHTTVFCEQSKITEFQIRDIQMHQEAELGIAAHWTYKEKVNPFKKNLAWIYQLKNWQMASDSKEFLESLRIDFFKNRIFVFTPKGDVIDLPEGATPVDFAYAIHSDLGDRCRMSKVNGKPTPISSPLKNNDIVEIIVDKNKNPSPDWLTFAKTSKARAKIRDSMRQRGLIK